MRTSSAINRDNAKMQRGAPRPGIPTQSAGTRIWRLLALLTLLLASLPPITATAAPASQAIDPQRIDALDVPRQWIELVHEQVSLHDIDLPQTTRAYAYLGISLHEALLIQSDGPSLHGRLNEMPPMPPRDLRAHYSTPAIAIGALSTVADALLVEAAPGGSQQAVRRAVESLRGTQSRLWRQRSGISPSVLATSRAYGDAIGTAVVTWAAIDGYDEFTARPFAVPTGDNAFWQPAPRDIRAGNGSPVQPFWGFLRTLSLAETAQCDVPLRLDFSTRRARPSTSRSWRCTITRTI